MNTFTYKLLIVSDSNGNEQIEKDIKTYVKYKGKDYEIDYNSIDYSTDYIKSVSFHGILLAGKPSNEIINDVLKYNNQAEIFVTEGEFDNSQIALISQEHISEQIIAFFWSRRFNTPFYDELRKITDKPQFRFHSPGHIGGMGLQYSKTGEEFFQFLGPNVLKHDISVSDDRMGSLLSHSSVFQKAENMISSAYHCKETYISVLGSSTSNKVVITSLLDIDEKVIIDRNIHKSIMHSVIISGGKPVFVKANFNKDFNALMPGRKEDIIQAIEENKDAVLLVLTSPSYEGIYFDWTEVVEHAHKYKMKVLIDESWGSHMHFHHAFMPDALACGADYVVHSFHKTLSSFSLASVIHVNDPDFDSIKGDFLENYLMFASTSPYYPLVSSMDVSRMQISIEGREILGRVIEQYEYANKRIKEIGSYRVLDRNELSQFYTDTDEIKFDYNKITVSYNSTNISKRDINEIFKKRGIVVEKINDYSFTILQGTGVFTDDIKYLVDALGEARHMKKKYRKEPLSFNFDDFTMDMSPQDAFFSQGDWVEIEKCIGKVSACMVVPYPPGIPVIIPGQVISEEIATSLEKMLKVKKMEIHGIFDGKIKIVRR